MNQKFNPTVVVITSIISFLVLIFVGIGVLVYLASTGETWAGFILAILGTVFLMGLGAIIFGGFQLASMRFLFKMNTAENLAMMEQQARNSHLLTGTQQRLLQMQQKLAPNQEPPLRGAIIRRVEDDVFDGVE